MLIQRHNLKIEDFLLVVAVEKKTLLIKEGKAGDKRKVGEKEMRGYLLTWRCSRDFSDVYSSLVKNRRFQRGILVCHLGDLCNLRPDWEHLATKPGITANKTGCSIMETRN